LRRTQQEEQGAGAFGRDLQPAARLEGELAADPAADGRDGAEPQRFLQRPQHLYVVCGLEQDEPLLGKAKPAQAVGVRPTEIGEAAAREDEERLTVLRRKGTAGEGGDEAEGGRHVSHVRRGEFVQRPASQPARGQMPIDRRQPERQGAAIGVCLGP
jgi:hypothetical protein